MGNEHRLVGWAIEPGRYLEFETKWQIQMYAPKNTTRSVCPT